MYRVRRLLLMCMIDLSFVCARAQLIRLPLLLTLDVTYGARRLGAHGRAGTSEWPEPQCPNLTGCQHSCGLAVGI